MYTGGIHIFLLSFMLLAREKTKTDFCGIAQAMDDMLHGLSLLGPRLEQMAAHIEKLSKEADHGYSGSHGNFGMSVFYTRLVV